MKWKNEINKQVKQWMLKPGKSDEAKQIISLHDKWPQSKKSLMKPGVKRGNAVTAHKTANGMNFECRA